MSQRISFIYIIICIAIFSMILSLSKGSMSIPFDQLLFNQNPLFSSIFFELRLPRTLSAFTTGALLGLSGQLMQLLLQNPLADPYVLGAASGAALMTLFLMLLGVSSAYLLGGACIGSLSSILLVLFLAEKHRLQSPYLLLSGIAINCGFAALISCILLLAPDKNLHSMLFWLAGDLNDAHIPTIEMLILCITFIWCQKNSTAFDILARGENEARALGLHDAHYRLMLYLFTSLLTATAVTLSGCIGFVGLIIPHLARKLVGFHHRFSLSVSALLGGSLLTLADTLSRSLLSPMQLPIGILMAFLGVPMFIYLLSKNESYRKTHLQMPIDLTALNPIDEKITLRMHNLIITRHNQPLFPSLSISIQPGERWGVLGRNGCGKSTLLHTLCGIIKHQNAEIRLNEKNISSLSSSQIAQKIGILLQNMQTPFAQTVFDYCLSARFPFEKNKKDVDIVWHALSMTNLLQLANQNINQLSEGEKRRVSIAALLTQTPSIFLLDEPCNHLDIHHQTQILDYFYLLSMQFKKSIILSLHDINLAEQFCTHCLLISQDQIFYGTTANVLTQQNLKHIYQQPFKRFHHENHVYWQAESAILYPNYQKANI